MLQPLGVALQPGPGHRAFEQERAVFGRAGCGLTVGQLGKLFGQNGFHLFLVPADGVARPGAPAGSSAAALSSPQPRYPSS